jgi:hypothetical protein
VVAAWSSRVSSTKNRERERTLLAPRNGKLATRFDFRFSILILGNGQTATALITSDQNLGGVMGS